MESNTIYEEEHEKVLVKSKYRGKNRSCLVRVNVLGFILTQNNAYGGPGALNPYTNKLINYSSS